MSTKKRKPEGEVYSIFKKKKPDADSLKPGSADSDATQRMDAKQKLLAFKNLLDFTEVTTEEEIGSRFDEISRMLLHELRIMVRRENKEDLELEVLEAEFYLQIGGCHEDPFTHGSEEQKISGRWYFHRAPRFSKDSHRNPTSLIEYRGGSRKGVDLTLGGPSQLASPSGSTSATSEGRLLRGGVLLRSVRQVSTGKVTSGPSLLVDLILGASGVSSIEELVYEKWAKDTCAFLPEEDDKQAVCLFLKPVVAAPRKPPPIYFSPRIGLELSHPGTTSATTLPLHPRIRFLPKRYRFFTNPALLIANGRAQTFLGILHQLTTSSSGASGSKTNTSLSRSISLITGAKEATAAKYLADYNAGREGGISLIDSFIGAKGKGASSSPATYLKMMGALSTIPT